MDGRNQELQPPVVPKLSPFLVDGSQIACDAEKIGQCNNLVTNLCPIES